MPGPFTITAQTPAVQLSDQREGQASYNVANSSGQPIRGRARLATLGQTQADWLKPIGDVERDFAAGETQPYAVQIQVPAAAAAGDYTFRLDMVGVENPDELYSQGPSVTFHVPEGAPPPKPVVKRGYLLVVAGGVVGGLVSLTIAFILASITSGLFHSEIVSRIVGAAVFAIVSGLGGWIALATGNCNWGRETALVLGAIDLIGAIIALSLFGSSIVLIFVLLVGLIIVPVIARAIVLQWKAGHI